MRKPKHTPQDIDKADAPHHEDHRDKQPYASELADRELEHAHKEKRPVDTPRRAGSGGESAR